MRLPRGPAPGTLQLRVKFSPTGCQAGRGISSTRSGRSAREGPRFLETCGGGTQGPRGVGLGIQKKGPDGEDLLTQGAGPGRERGKVVELERGR